MGVIERRRGTDTGAVSVWSIWEAPFTRWPQHDATQALKRVEPYPHGGDVMGNATELCGVPAGSGGSRTPAQGAGWRSPLAAPCVIRKQHQ
jgi:hypothetical protein